MDDTEELGDFTLEEQSDFFDITIDDNFIGNALTSVMIMNGDITDREYVTVEYIERDGIMFNIIVKRNKLIVNW